MPDGPILSCGAWALQHFADVPFGSRRTDHFARDLHTLGSGDLPGGGRRGLADLRAPVDQCIAAQQLLGQLTRHVDVSAEDKEPVHALRLKGRQRHVGQLLAGGGPHAANGCGGHAEERVGRVLLFWVIGQVVRTLVGRHPLAVGRPHINLEAIFEDREDAARGGRCVGEQQGVRRAGLAQLDVRAGMRWAANHHATHRLGPLLPRPGTEHRPGDGGGVAGGVNHLAGENGLAARAIGHDDPAQVALGVVQHVGDHAAVQILHAGCQQRVIQQLLDMHGPRWHRDRMLRLAGDLVRPDHVPVRPATSASILRPASPRPSRSEWRVLRAVRACRAIRRARR